MANTFRPDVAAQQQACQPNVASRHCHLHMSGFRTQFETDLTPLYADKSNYSFHFDPLPFFLRQHRLAYKNRVRSGRFSPCHGGVKRTSHESSQKSDKRAHAGHTHEFGKHPDPIATLKP